jgi:hypothetical protein
MRERGNEGAWKKLNPATDQHARVLLFFDTPHWGESDITLAVPRQPVHRVARVARGARPEPAGLSRRRRRATVYAGPALGCIAFGQQAWKRVVLSSCTILLSFLGIPCVKDCGVAWGGMAAPPRSSKLARGGGRGAVDGPVSGRKLHGLEKMVKRALLPRAVKSC